MHTEYHPTIVVGAGQAGLSTGHHLRRLNQSFVVLEGNERVGDNWRKRWDSLRLFTPAQYDGLHGLRFPAKAWTFPAKNEMGDYLEAYAAHFGIPVRTGVRVDALFAENGRYVITAGDRRFEADQVVLATGAHHVPRTPPFASQLDPAILQLHAGEYRNPSQLREGDVLVVGNGNSGAEIGKEIARTHRTFISGRAPKEIPVRHGSLAARFVVPVVRLLAHRVLNLATPIGRAARPKFLSMAAPLIRVKLKDLQAAGVAHVPRVAGVREGQPLLEDGREMQVANVIWCTGFRGDHSWIQLPIFDERGVPMHNRGVVSACPGIYFVGLRFQYAVSSDVIPGVGRDARYIVDQVVERKSSTGG